jgi:DNA-binding XRE family transcriptional regulator
VTFASCIDELLVGVKNCQRQDHRDPVAALRNSSAATLLVVPFCSSSQIGSPPCIEGGFVVERMLPRRRWLVKTKTVYQRRYRNLIARLRAARESLGMTQSDVATSLGVYGTWVNKVECCELALDLLRLIDLCRVYGLSVEREIRMLEEDSP